MKKAIIALLAVAIMVPATAYAIPGQRITVRNVVRNLVERVESGESQINKINQTVEIQESFPNGTGKMSIGHNSGDDNPLSGSFAIGNYAAVSSTQQDYAYNLYFGIGSGWHATSSQDVAVGHFTLDTEGYTGNQNTVMGHGALGSLVAGTNNSVFGNGALSGVRNGSRNSVLGLGTAINVNSLNKSALVGEDALNGASGDIEEVAAFGWEAGKNSTSSHGVYLGTRAGYGETTDHKLHIANRSSESLIEGNFETREVQINGSLEMESIVIGGTEYTLSVSSTDLVLTPAT